MIIDLPKSQYKVFKSQPAPPRWAVFAAIAVIAAASLAWAFLGV